MAQKHRHRNNRQIHRSSAPSPPPLNRAAAMAGKVVTQYGKTFILLEDSNKNTFEFKAGQWVAHDMTIAECRESGQVKALPQKVNGMTRYEVRSALPADD